MFEFTRFLTLRYKRLCFSPAHTPHQLHSARIFSRVFFYGTYLKTFFPVLEGCIPPYVIPTPLYGPPYPPRPTSQPNIEVFGSPL